MVKKGAKHIDQEYAYTLRVNEKSDTYSFGVVILELVTGKRLVDPEYGEKDLVKAKLDDNVRLLDFTEKLEAACIATVEAGKMTKDLTLLIHGPK
ncbi:hypothetical protein AAC387_Pa05g1961 [Persea americana]